MEEVKQQFTLPTAVVGPTDVSRLTREVQNIDEFFRQSEIRKGGTPNSLPRYSRILDELVVSNKLNLLQSKDRLELIAELANIQKIAPVVHVSFSVDPPGPYVQKIVAWLRENIAPKTLVRVGLQPNIGAGCILRTTNKTFDFSLRKFFDSKHDFFAQKLHEAVVDIDDDDVAKQTSVADNETTPQKAPVLSTPKSMDVRPAPELPADGVEQA